MIRDDLVEREVRRRLSERGSVTLSHWKLRVAACAVIAAIVSPIITKYA